MAHERGDSGRRPSICPRHRAGAQAGPLIHVTETSNVVGHALPVDPAQQADTGHTGALTTVQYSLPVGAGRT